MSVFFFPLWLKAFKFAYAGLCGAGGDGAFGVEPVAFVERLFIDVMACGFDLTALQPHRQFSEDGVEVR